MINKKSILKLVFVAIVPFFIHSCKQEDVPKTAQGDVFVKSVQKGDSIVYGVCYYAYSWDKMSKATVYRDGADTKMNLDSMLGRYTFFRVPDSLEFKPTKPVRAKYIFNVDFDNGDQVETADILDSTCLKPVVIKKFDFDTETDKLIIEWEATALVDQYFVVLENEKRETVYQSGGLNAAQTYLWIYSSTNGWSTNEQPVGGEKYKASIFAYQYEPVLSSFMLLQSISIAESNYVEWIIEDN